MPANSSWMKRRGRTKQREGCVQRSCGRRKSRKYREPREGSAARGRETKVSPPESEVGEMCRVHTRTYRVAHVETFSVS